MIGHSFICADSGNQKLMRFSASGNLEWEYPARGSFDIWQVGNGNILFSMLAGPNGPGVQMINYNKEVLFEYYTKGEVFGCQPLADGNILIGELEPCRLLEVDSSGTVKKIVQLFSKCSGHHAMRMLRKLANGNYLVGHSGDQTVREYNSNGKIVREIVTSSPVFAAIRLPNGNTLLSREDAVVEVDQDNRVIWELSGKDVPEINIRLLTGLQRLPNGNTMVANWMGHHPTEKAVPLFEVTPSKKVVWKFLSPNIKNLGNFQLLDIQGEPLR